MSALLERTTTTRRGTSTVPSPWVAGSIAAVQAAAGSLVVVLAPVVLAWALTSGAPSAGGSSGAPTPWTSAARVALALWLLAQHGGLALSGGAVIEIVPLGLTLVPLAAAWFAGRRLARTLDPHAERIDAGATVRGRAAVGWRAPLAMGALHAGLGALAAVLARTDTLTPVLWQAALGAGAVGLVGGCAGAAAYRHGGLIAGLRSALDRLPQPVRGWVAPAVTAVAVQVAGGALLLAACLALGFSRVGGLAHALDAGAVGGAVLVVAQAALLPNLAIWSASAAAGPGFAVGVGTSVTPVASTLGALPAVPVLAALPAPGPLPTPVLAVLLLPLTAGVVATTLLLRRAAAAGASPSRFAVLGHVGAVAVLAGVGFAALAFLSGGAAGPGRLAQVGPTPHLVAAVFAAEVLAGGLLTLLVRRAAPWLADELAAQASALWARLRGVGGGDYRLRS